VLNTSEKKKLCFFFIFLVLFHFPLKNFSLLWRRNYYWWRTAKFRLGPLSRKISLSCHTCCDTGPRLSRSHPKDRPIQPPLTTHKGKWRPFLIRILMDKTNYVLRVKIKVKIQQQNPKICIKMDFGIVPK
jgi:hypothetical protein